MDQQAMEKGEEEHEAQKYDDEEFPKLSVKHLQRSLDQQAMEKGEAEYEAQRSNEGQLSKIMYQEDPYRGRYPKIKFKTPSLKIIPHKEGYVLCTYAPVKSVYGTKLWSHFTN